MGTYLGQNFLRDTSVLTRIIEAGEIKKGETVLEIGPGEGVLTRALLDAGANVLAVEKDARLVKHLDSRYPSEIASGQLHLINDDILKLDISSLFANCKLGISSFKLISNIPYYITGEILRKFLTANAQPTLMVLLVQKEVAERIVDTKESILSLSVKAYGTPSYICTVPRTAFDPEPKVDSAVLKIESISRAFFEDSNMNEDEFFKLVRSGFAHKRKRLGNNIELPTRLRERFGEATGQELSLADWALIHNSII